MKHSGFVRKILAAVLIISTMTACSGSGKATGNVKDVVLENGDTFAVITIQNFGDITVKLFPEIAPKAVEQFVSLAERGYYDGKTIHRVIENTLIQGGSLVGDGTDGNVYENAYFANETSDKARHFNGALCFANGEKGNYCQFYFVSNNKALDLTKIAENIRTQLADETIAARLTAEKKKYYEDYCKSIELTSAEVLEKYNEAGGVFRLDGEDTVFGQTIDGFDVIEAISKVEVVSGNEIDDNNKILSKPSSTIIIEKVEIVHFGAEEDSKKKS